MCVLTSGSVSSLSLRPARTMVALVARGPLPPTQEGGLPGWSTVQGPGGSLRGILVCVLVEIKREIVSAGTCGAPHQIDSVSSQFCGRREPNRDFEG